MKKIHAGGFLFIGGCIFCSLGLLGLAATHKAFGYYELMRLFYIGVPAIITGVILGTFGFRKKD